MSSNAAEISAKIAKVFTPGGEGFAALSSAMEKACIGVEGSAKRRAPVRTSNLRNSITHTTDDDTAYIGTNVEYGIYVHEGTVKMQANRFLKNAVHLIGDPGADC